MWYISQSARWITGSLCFFSLHIFFLRFTSWQDGRYHLTEMLLLYLPPWKYHHFAVLHRAFYGVFNRDTSGLFSIYFHGGKRCTDAAALLFISCIGAPFATCSNPSCSIFRNIFLYARFIWCFHKSTFRNACASNITILQIWRRHLWNGAAKQSNELKTLSIHLSSGCKMKQPSSSQSCCGNMELKGAKKGSLLCF